MIEVKHINVPIRINPYALQELLRELDQEIPEWSILYWPPTGNNTESQIRLERKDG